MTIVIARITTTLKYNVFLGEYFAGDVKVFIYGIQIIP